MSIQALMRVRAAVREVQCNLDRLWARWQGMHPDEPYLPTTGGSPGHNLNYAPPLLTTPGATPTNRLNYQMNLGYVYDAL
jgi:hypothetical protein